MNLAAVRASVAVALGGAGWPPYPVLPAQPDLPCAVVNAPSSILYHQSFAGETVITMPVTLLVSRADEQSAQASLNAALSFEDGSIVYHLEAAPRADWSSLVVRSAGPFVAVTIADTQALGCDLVLELTA